MTKTLFKINAIIMIGAIMAACHKDEVNTTNQPEFPTEYSELSVEQNKKNLEDNGIELADNITTLKNTSGVQASIAFSEYLDGSERPESIGGRIAASNNGIRLIELLGSFGKGNSSVENVLAGMRTSEDFASFKDEYTDLLGVYTYDKANDTWLYEKTGDQIIFKFPSTKTGTANNAQYSVYGYQGVTISSNLGGDNYTGDYPTALKADLTIDGVKKMGYDFSAAYNSSGDPSAVTVIFTIDNFNLKYALTNSTSEGKIEYSLTQGDKILFAWGVIADGSFSSDKIESSNDAGDVLTSGSAYFQIMNIKFSGKVQVKSLTDALNVATTDAQKVAAWNDNYKLLVFYADSKQKIADSEFYVATKTETDCYYNDDDELVCDEEHEVSYLDVRMVFADGTKSDLKTYTDVGFQDLQDKLETLDDM